MPRKKYPYYPIYIDVEDHDVLIVGGGTVCARKAETMLRYGARVTVVTKKAGPEIEQLASSGRIRLRRKAYQSSDLNGQTLVIASTDDPGVNSRVARDCRRKRIPVNVVDVTHLCEFIVPAIVQQGSIQIAVSTAGKSPALARTIKETLQKSFGPEWAELNEVLGSLRAGAKKALETDLDRKRFFDSIVARDVVTLFRQGKRREAGETIAAICRDAGVPLSDELSAMIRSDERYADKR